MPCARGCSHTTATTSPRQRCGQPERWLRRDSRRGRKRPGRGRPGRPPARAARRGWGAMATPRPRRRARGRPGGRVPGPPRPAAAGPAAAPSSAAGSPYQHPHPQPRPCPSHQTTVGDLTTILTGESIFLPSLPYLDPPGTNFLPTVYTNLFDGAGNEIPNTLPSTPSIAYNLLDGDPVVSQIDATSPRDDLANIFNSISLYATQAASS